jgi:DNA-binding CsgD family transcriptional regulator/tetratricopeptide (TPR) repeat protein
VRPPLPPSWTGAGQPPFVGCRRELAKFEDIWSAVLTGARQVVFVGGGPGAGKSRLLAEVSSVLYRHEAAVLFGACIAELGLSYQPFVEPIETLLPALASGELSSGDGRSGDEQAMLQRLMALVGRHGAGWEAGSKRDYQRDLYDAAVGAFRAVAAQRPLVLVLEDLQWASDTAFQMLTYLAQHTPGARLLVLATHRAAVQEQADPWTHMITQLDRLEGVHRLDLEALDIEDVTDYLVRQTQLPPHRVRPAASILRGQTGGNPFILRELWRDLSARGGLAAMPTVDLQAPASVRDMFQVRLDRLAASHRHVLECAAVIGEAFEVAILLAAAELSPEATLTALDEAVVVGLIEPVPDAGGMLRFPHALARQSVVELTPLSRRTLSHARVAEVIEGQFPAIDRHVQRLAHHYSGAQVLGHGGKAVRYLVEAGRLADRSLAHEDAAALFERAAALSNDPDQRDELRLDAARSYFMGADFARARALDEQVANAAGQPGNRARAAIGFETACLRAGHPRRRAVELLTDAIRALDPDPSDPTYVRSLASRGRALTFTGATDEARALIGRAVELARSLDDEGPLLFALQADLWHPIAPHEARARLERATELCDMANHIGDLDHLGPASYCRGITAYQLGESESLDAARVDLLQAARRTGQGFFDYQAGCLTYARQFMAGDFIEAERTCTAQLELGEAFGSDSAEGPYGLAMYMIRRETGALEQIRPLITGDERPTERWAPGLLALYTELELSEPTSRLLRWLLENDLPHHRHSSQWPGVLALMVEAALSLSDVPAAIQLRPLVAEHAGFNLAASGLTALFGSADRYLGAIDSLLGSGEPEELFASALEMDTRMHAPVHQAQTLAAQIIHMRRRGTSGPRLAEATERAGSLADRLGLRRVRRVLDQPATRTLRSPRADGLTVRETEVLVLLGKGHSNREIAKRLVISENTTANHVRSVLLKTGSVNRTQAAMYAAAQGLLH